MHHRLDGQHKLFIQASSYLASAGNVDTASAGSSR
jgi:hypothetical protein